MALEYILPYTAPEIDDTLGQVSVHGGDIVDLENDIKTINSNILGINDDIAALVERLNTLANSDDTTLDQMSEIVEYIKNNKDLIDGVTTAKVSIVDIVNNLNSASVDKPLSAAAGKMLKDLLDELEVEVEKKAPLSHRHAIADVTDLQTELNDRAPAVHTHLIGNITDLQSTLDGKAPANHNHIAATQSVAGYMSADDKKKLDGIASGANVYSHPTTSGNKHIPSGGSAGQILRWSADGTAAWGADNNTTYLVASTGADGLMSASDKTKLDGIAAGANKYSHPNSGVTAGTYKKVTVNAAGHVTAGENPTTLVGYGITDAEAKGTASSLVSTHNSATNAHADIRTLITNLTTKLNNLANSDDTTLDQMKEVVAYIKNNKALIDSITTSKVNVSDIVNNLTTNTSNKPLSAAQGYALNNSVTTLNNKLSSISQIIVGTSAPSSSNVVENALYIRIIE